MPIIVEVKNWKTEKIPIAEIEKLVGDCKCRHVSGAILIINKDASLHDNAYKHLLD
jgi:hypothetical protein